MDSFSKILLPDNVGSDHAEDPHDFEAIGEILRRLFSHHELSDDVTIPKPTASRLTR